MDPGNWYESVGERLFQAHRSSKTKEEFEEKVILAANRLKVSTKNENLNEQKKTRPLIFAKLFSSPSCIP